MPAALLLLSQASVAQELTPAGRAIVQQRVTTYNALDGPARFPLPVCMFAEGLCGAIRRDGSIAVAPRYDWVGSFADGRAAVRVGGLYGFVDEDGREVVKPQYRIVGDFQFGFAQVDVDGRSGLIDRDGKMVIAPTYGFVEAIAVDRFRVADRRIPGDVPGGEDFSLEQWPPMPPAVSFRVTPAFLTDGTFRIVDLSGNLIETTEQTPSLPFDPSDPSLRLVRKNRLWGIARDDGSWLAAPTFDRAESLKDGLARVVLRGKTGFIDRTGAFVIQPTFDRAGRFAAGVGRTNAERDGVVGLIDKTGAFVLMTDYQDMHLAVEFNKNVEHALGWHFKLADRWGLLDLDGRTLIEAQFDSSISSCPNGHLLARRGQEWLLFRDDGSSLLPPGGRLLSPPCGGSSPYVLAIGDKLGLIDTELRPVTQPIFDEIKPASHDTRNVRIGNKWGRIGTDGRWVLAAKFDHLSQGSHLIVATIDGKRGILNGDGTWLIEPKFDAAGIRDSETAFVSIGGATGVLRITDQSWQIEPRRGVMCDIPGAVMSQNDGKVTILSPAGETWIDLGAERIGIQLATGLLAFFKNGKWGFVDTAGHIVVEPTYDEPAHFIPPFRGIAWAKRDDRWCAIDRHGRQVQHIPCREKDPFPTDRFECKVEP